MILIKCFRARSKRKKLFNYDKTRKYTYIRIAGADKKQCEALQSLLDPKKRQHPLESMLRHCQFPTVYSLASLVPVVGGLLMALVGAMLVYRCLSRPGERLSHSKERYTEWRKCKNIMNESVNSNSLASIAGMEKLRKDQTLFLLLTAFITQVLCVCIHSFVIRRSDVITVVRTQTNSFLNSGGSHFSTSDQLHSTTPQKGG